MAELPCTLHDLTEVRARRPAAVSAAAAARTRRPLLDGTGRLFLIAADHPARGSLGVSGQPMAMANRLDLLARIQVALARPGVHGVLGTADLLEDLLLLGALENRVVFGSMNRGGLLGASFELDDQFTGCDAPTLAAMGFDGGKMLLRIDPADPGSLRTLRACANAVNQLAASSLTALVEPFISYRDHAGAVRNDLSTDAMVRAVSVAAGLGATSAYTWLKVPVVADMERVAEASTLPTLLLGGDPGRDPDAVFDGWARALKLPGVRGLVAGRALLYPPDGDVAATVDAAVSLF